MKFTGTITVVGMIRSGTSKAGNPWESQTFVIEEDTERAPMSVAFDVWDKNKFQFQKGEKCTVFLEIKANEGKDGRWFNSVQVFKKEGGYAPGSIQPQTAPPPSLPPTSEVPPTDDLLF